MKYFHVFMLMMCTFTGITFTKWADPATFNYDRANERGNIFDELPEDVIKAAKPVTITLSDCKEPMVVQIENILPKDAPLNLYQVTEVLRFTPNKKSQTAHLLKRNISTTNMVQSVVINVMPESTWQLKIGQDIVNTTHDPKARKKAQEINKDLRKAPQNIFEFYYDDIKPHQTIKLTCPSEGKPNIDQISEHFAANMSGAEFDKLPESIKKSGKKLKLSLSFSSSADMLIHIGQWVLFPSGTYKRMNQKVVISGSTESITVDLPQTPQGKGHEEISFWICPLKVNEYLQQPFETRKHYNFNDELDKPGQPANGETRLMQALATTVSYSYDTLPKQIVLPNPMEMLTEILNCNY